MTAGNLCEQCKAHSSPPRSQRESPSGSSARSSSTLRSCAAPPPGRTNPNKPIYVRMDPSDQTCIVLGKGECGAQQISLQLPSTPGGCNNKLRLKCGDGGGGSGSGNCIEITGNSIIKTQNGGLQIVPSGKGKRGGMQISLGKSGCPVLQLSGGSARSCGSSSGNLGRELQLCPGGGGQLQLNFSKGKCGGGPSIICGPGGSNVEISYGPQKRKLDMNHCKPTIASMIHKRLIELEAELRMAECAYSNLHP